jgi:hypothetical protein
LKFITDIPSAGRGIAGSSFKGEIKKKGIFFAIGKKTLFDFSP